MASVGHDEGPFAVPPDGTTVGPTPSKPASKAKGQTDPSEPASKAKEGKWTAPNLFTCHICGKVIKYRSNFVRHMQRQHKPKTAVCPTCGKVFRDKCELRNHMDSGAHLGRKTPHRYTCATCGGQFTSQRALLHHSHDKVSAFPCDICRRRFKTAVVCAAHRRRHLWLGLPRCRVCSATFASEQHLSRHIRNHESETSEVVRY